MSLNVEQGLHIVVTFSNKFFLLLFRTKKTRHVLEKSVLDRAFVGAIDGQAVESGGRVLERRPA